MPIDDPLFSRADLTTPSYVKPWWRHPAWLIALIAIIAAVLAILTGKDPEPAPTIEVEVPIEVNYVDELAEQEGQTPASPGE